MADDTKPPTNDETPQGPQFDVAVGPEDLKRIEDYLKTAELLTEESAKQADFQQKLQEWVVASHGKQFELMTMAEKRLALYEKEDELLQSKIRDLELIARQHEKERMNEQETKRLAELLKQYDDLSADAAREKIAMAKAIVLARQEQLDREKKIVSAQEQAAEFTERTLQKTLGLKNTTEDIADLWLDAGGNTEEFLEVMEGAGKKWNEFFGKGDEGAKMRKKMGLKLLKNQMKDLAGEAQRNMFGADSLLMRYEDLGRSLTQATGATEEYGDELKDLTGDMRGLNYTMDETARAYQTLYATAAAFSDFAAEQRKEITELSLDLTRLGVATDTFGATLTSMNKVFKENPAQIKKTATSMVNFARALKVGPNEMLQLLNQNMSLVTKYGKEQGIKVFEQLAVTMKKTGVAMSELVNIAKQFDTFEGAAEAAGQLNMMLGGPLLNSINMMMADESQRIQQIRDAVKQSGKDFAELGRFEKEHIAKMMGTSVDVAQALFNDENIGTIEAATEAIKNQAAGMGEMSEAAREADTLANKKAAADEAMLDVMSELGPAMKAVNETIIFFGKMMQWLAPIMFIANGALMVWEVLQIKAAATAAAKNAQQQASIALSLQEIAANAALATSNAGVTASEAALTGAMTAQGGAATGAALQTGTLGGVQGALAVEAATATSAELALASALAVEGTAAGAATAPTLGFAAAMWAVIGPILAIVAPILAVVGVIALVVVYFDDLVSATSYAFEYLGNFFDTWLSSINSVAKGFMYVIAGVIEGFMQVMFSPLTALVEGAAFVLDYIPGMGGIAGGLRSFSPGRIIHQYASEIYASIEGFKEGGNTGAGGLAVVGEAGPEIRVNAPNSEIISNDNIGALAAALTQSDTNTVKEQTLNVKLMLDSDVLAEHSAQVAQNVIHETFEFTV